MPLPVMPNTVPYLARRGEWSMPQPYIPPIETDMDGGNTRERSTPGSNVAIVQQVIRMTKAQYATFDTFVRSNLNNGTSRFTWTVWTGAALVTKTVQFTKDGQPQPGDGGLKVAVSMKLRIYGMP